MNVSLAFCRLAYEDIIGKKLPANMPYKDAGNQALAKDRKRFMELAKQEGFAV